MTLTVCRFKKTARGFTLAEVMIVVAIVAILVAIGLPSYLDSVRKSRRADAMQDLMEVASRQERFYAQNGTYTADISASTGLNLGRTVSLEGHYNLTAAACARAGATLNECYLLTAIPQGAQSRDSKCGSLTMNSLGQRNATGSRGDACW